MLFGGVVFLLLLPSTFLTDVLIKEELSFVLEFVCFLVSFVSTEDGMDFNEIRSLMAFFSGWFFESFDSFLGISLLLDS